MKSKDALKQLHAIDRDCCLLEKTAAILHWDQETNLPSRGVEERADQLALVEGLAHERLTDPRVGRLLADLGSDEGNPSGDEALPPVERDFCRVLRRRYDRAVKLPPGFVAAAARAASLSQTAWVKARRKNDFAAFVPYLGTMVDFARMRAEYWGFTGAAVYDGLLDAHEPGIAAEEIARLFGPLREGLSALLKQIRAKTAASPEIEGERAFLNQSYDTERQARYSRTLMERLGFDLSRGRLDTSAHPFTTTLGFDDVRITTHYKETSVLSAIFSTIHESGHAFYEMDIDPELRGTCLAEGVSMGIHESQSRLWENVFGRSRAFWECLFPQLKALFPEQLGSVTTDGFYRAVNRVSPSLIRIEADELSYSLHVILRFELERRLFSGDLPVEDLPRAWRRSMKELLGVEPETDAEGVLQDVHWSMGSFGYFPSYALGNLYGLQFLNTLRRDLPDYESDIARGNFSAIRQWLRENIYTWGRRLDPADLLLKVTGEKLSVAPFLEYIEGKYTDIYTL
ncbi:MAG: carboxypeptidase M32 [Spirochaetaceae bacterium]|jgi:carboxypeptidase Taq|nr:carboxypeptidase M32 [Spirochaetaceae bacterium]